MDALHIIFSDLPINYPGPEVYQFAIDLHRQRSVSLGDALIAATAIMHGLKLAIHNNKDFEWIKPLEVFDPMQG